MLFLGCRTPLTDERVPSNRSLLNGTGIFVQGWRVRWRTFDESVVLVLVGRSASPKADGFVFHDVFRASCTNFVYRGI
jgi:hypothetical protein